MPRKAKPPNALDHALAVARAEPTGAVMVPDQRDAVLSQIEAVATGVDYTVESYRTIQDRLNKIGRMCRELREAREGLTADD